MVKSAPDDDEARKSPRQALKSRTTAGFRRLFEELSKPVQIQAREAHKHFVAKPSHPGLRFKRVHPALPVFSVRISRNYRAVGTQGAAGAIARSFALVAAVFVGAVAFAGERLDLSIHGVTLRTLKPAVHTALGKPLRTETGHDSEIGLGDFIDVTYPGLLVQLCRPEVGSPLPRTSDFHVWRIQATDARWEISPGLRVGMSRTALERVLGKPRSSKTNDGTTALTFSPFPFKALMWAKVKNGVVTEIGMAEDWT